MLRILKIPILLSIHHIMLFAILCVISYHSENVFMTIYINFLLGCYLGIILNYFLSYSMIGWKCAIDTPYISDNEIYKTIKYLNENKIPHIKHIIYKGGFETEERIYLPSEAERVRVILACS